MKRLWIPLNSLQIYDRLHWIEDGKLKVDEEGDGQSLEKHLSDIAYIKSVLEKGQKIAPILALDNEDGTYTRLDGFKRCSAYLELGYKFIEAFVCSKFEYEHSIEYPYGDYVMRCFHGGQDGEKGKFPLFEGGERENFNYNDTIFLYKSPNSDGLRIEISESIHVHWGPFGKYRLSLGRRDFEKLAKAWEKF